MIDRLRQFAGACWVALTSLTLAQLNAALGFISLVLGISYQIWKWRRDLKSTDRRQN